MMFWRRLISDVMPSSNTFKTCQRLATEWCNGNFNIPLMSIHTDVVTTLTILQQHSIWHQTCTHPCLVFVHYTWFVIGGLANLQACVCSCTCVCVGVRSVWFSFLCLVPVFFFFLRRNVGNTTFRPVMMAHVQWCKQCIQWTKTCCVLCWRVWIKHRLNATQEFCRD